MICDRSFSADFIPTNNNWYSCNCTRKPCGLVPRLHLPNTFLTIWEMDPGTSCVCFKVIGKNMANILYPYMYILCLITATVGALTTSTTVYTHGMGCTHLVHAHLPKHEVRVHGGQNWSSTSMLWSSTKAGVGWPVFPLQSVANLTH